MRTKIKYTLPTLRNCEHAQKTSTELSFPVLAAILISELNRIVITCRRNAWRETKVNSRRRPTRSFRFTRLVQSFPPEYYVVYQSERYLRLSNFVAYGTVQDTVHRILAINVQRYTYIPVLMD